MFAYQIRNGEKKRRQRSPLEENIWLMPAGCTDVEPPEFDPNTHTCHYDGNEWIVTAIPESTPEPTPEPVSAMEQLQMQRLQEAMERIELQQSQIDELTERIENLEAQ